MKKSFLLIPFLILSLLCDTFAQTAPNTYIVWFNNKANTPYQISQPLSFLSQRSVTRRANQSIAINTHDLPVDPVYIDSVRNMGPQVLNRSRWLNAISVYCTDSNIMAQVNALSFVQMVQPVKRLNQGFHHTKFEPPDYSVPNYKNLKPSGLPSSLNYGNSFDQVHMLMGDLLHANGFQGYDKVIAVIDAGFLDADQLDSFDSLWANNQILGTWDFVSGNNNVFDDHSHGTMVLSTMGGNIPGELIGTAPKAKFWLLRSEDAATEYLVEEFNWVCAAEFADSAGADVINSSLGYTTFDNPSMDHFYGELDGNTCMATRGADFAAASGMVVCNSAGNSGASPWFYISVPADADSILAVGAVDNNEVVAGFSSRGNSADGRIKPDVAAMGVQTVVQSMSGGTQTGNGTSFASPLVAGMCASLWQANPGYSAMQLIEAVKMSCDQYGNPDSLKGYGVPDFSIAYSIVTGRKLSAPGKDSLLGVYPNPFNEYLDFIYYTTDSQHISIRLIDICGREVYHKQAEWQAQSFVHEKIIPETILPHGIYLLQLQTPRHTLSQKVVKL